ncbi:MAG: hypothetical protein IT210_13550 [Armatimonadetes bacterium]|nr:hypothetical protein [Armatimonadota bacterium]
MEALGSRFEDVTETIALRLNGIEDIALLKQLFRLALKAGSTEEFLQQLPQ